LRLFENESYGEALVITQAAYYIFCFILAYIVDAEDARVFLAVKYRRLGPAYVI
jgi:hypothetical protein